MANTMLSFEQISFDGIQEKYSSKVFVNGEGEYGAKQTDFYGVEDWREVGQVDSLFPGFGFCQDSTAEEGLLLPKYEEQEQQKELFSDYGILDDLRFDMISPILEPFQEGATELSNIPTEISGFVETKREKPQPFRLASLELLKNYGSGFKRLNGEKLYVPSHDTANNEEGPHKLSTEEIIRIAGEKFIQSSSQKVDNVSMFSHPFSFSFSGLSAEEAQGVELVTYLLASAERVGYQQYERASKLLNQCVYMSSRSGNTVQRVVHYFSQALWEKIDRETGRITAKGLGNKLSLDLEEAMMSPNPTILACHNRMPFSQAAQFSGIQAILENVAEAKNIHLIDLAIRNGVQWTPLMQALAVRHECPVELLKITAVGTISRAKIEETGERLVSFAKTLNLPISFKVVMVSDMQHLDKDLFELEAAEAIAIYIPFILWTMIGRPNCLESLMRVIKNINPRIIVVNEIEANHNSPVFVTRFIEALFFFSACFDCLETCMDRNDSNRMITESVYFGQGIRNIVATEGDERTIRHVKVDVWRAFFARFGMAETELSMSSLYQASLVVKKFACADSYTLEMNKKCLIIGWKGTPVLSHSAWKFV